MAALQQRNGRFRILFSHAGKQLTFTIGKVSREEAEARAGQVDLLLLRLSQRLAVLPPGMTIVDYLKYDGRPLTAEAPTAKAVKLSTLREKYLTANRDALEPTTLDCIRTHFRHLERILGAAFHISSLRLTDLQRYVDRRAKQAGKNGRRLSATTIHKEVMTLRAAWRWGSRSDLVSGPFPNDGLRYPRTREKPPFMTRQEIEQRIAADHPTEAEIADLWHSLYLTTEEVTELLAHVRQKTIQPFLYPALCFVAHTGARRSEMLRARVADIDFANRMVTIHEKKRVKGRDTSRRVPLTPFLETVLKDWLAAHPGGAFLFCQEDMPRRGVYRRTKGGSGTQLNRGKAYDHFGRAVADSKWAVVAGWHVLRHSFISACAMKGIDQRFIDEWVGHETEAMKRRYRHLAPSSQRQALSTVFG